MSEVKEVRFYINLRMNILFMLFMHTALLARLPHFYLTLKLKRKILKVSAISNTS